MSFLSSYDSTLERRGWPHIAAGPSQTSDVSGKRGHRPLNSFRKPANLAPQIRASIHQRSFPDHTNAVAASSMNQAATRSVEPALDPTRRAGRVPERRPGTAMPYARAQGEATEAAKPTSSNATPTWTPPDRGQSCGVFGASIGCSVAGQRDLAASQSSIRAHWNVDEVRVFIRDKPGSQFGMNVRRSGGNCVPRRPITAGAYDMPQRRGDAYSKNS